MNKIDSVIRRWRICVCYAQAFRVVQFHGLRCGFRENPTGNNGDVFRDLAGGPLTPPGHLRDSATTFATQQIYILNGSLGTFFGNGRRCTMFTAMYVHCYYRQFTYSRARRRRRDECCIRFRRSIPESANRVSMAAPSGIFSPFTGIKIRKPRVTWEVIVPCRSIVCKIVKLFLYLWTRASTSIKRHNSRMCNFFWKLSWTNI